MKYTTIAQSEESRIVRQAMGEIATLLLSDGSIHTYECLIHTGNRLDPKHCSITQADTATQAIYAHFSIIKGKNSKNCVEYSKPQESLPLGVCNIKSNTETQHLATTD